MGFIVLALLSFATVEGLAQSKEVNRLSLLTGGTGGVYYPYGGALAQVISKYVPNTISTAEVTAAAVDNIKLMKAGKGELAMIIADVASDAINGVGRFEKDGKIPLRTLAVLYGNLNHMVVMKESGIQTVAGIEGPPGFGGGPGKCHGSQIVAHHRSLWVRR